MAKSGTTPDRGDAASEFNSRGPQMERGLLVTREVHSLLIGEMNITKQNAANGEC